MRRAPVATLLLLSMAILPVRTATAHGDPCAGTSPADPQHRIDRLPTQAPGTEETYCIFFGPFTIPPGHDLSRLEVDLSATDGYLVAGAPSAVEADGLEPGHQEMHIHHAHWWVLEPGRPNYGPQVPLPGWSWIAGSGEEETEGDFDLVASAEEGGPRYGLPLHAGDRVLFINMLHNKTSRPYVVWVRVFLRFVHGTQAQLAERGKQFEDLTPVLLGGSFDIPRTPGKTETVFPLEASGTPSGELVPGTGFVFEAPFSGTMVIGAGHFHPGGKRLVVTNLGQPGDPCGSTRSDGIPGTTLYELDAVYRTVPYSEDFQIEITQPGFRATVKQGDRIALNGVYESADHAWWDQMAHTGFFVDQHEVGARPCAPELVGRPAGYTPPLMGDYPDLPAIEGVPNRAWSGDADPVCGIDGWAACEGNKPVAPRGGETPGIMIAGFKFLPGDLDMPAALARTPVVRRGSPLHVYNADFIPALIRHTVTSCQAPCDGNYTANYPLPDGAFDSGYLGYEPTTEGGIPYFSLETAGLPLGRTTFFCRVHPWMRGAFEVVEQ